MPSSERFVDFAAVGRVSARVELKTIRVIDVSAKCDPKMVGALDPMLDLNCEIIGRERSVLQVACAYKFSARVADVQVVDAMIRYLLDYEIQGDAPLVDEDIAEFGYANGTLHSWPFVREFVYGLTSKMGFPPYTLPVFHFKPKPHAKVEPAEKAAVTQESGTPEAEK
jgi:hypothetical protein